MKTVLETLIASSIVLCLASILSAQGDSIPSALKIDAGSEYPAKIAGEDEFLILSTQPAVGIDPTDWPTIAIGDQVVVVARESASAKNATVALVPLEGEPRALVEQLPISSDGVLADKLEILVARIDEVALLNINETLILLDASSSASFLQVDFIAPRETEWAFETFEYLHVTTNDVAAASGSSGEDRSSELGRSVDPDTVKELARLKSVIERARGDVAQQGNQAKRAEDTGVQETVFLRVFSPPGVRGRSRSSLPPTNNFRKEDD